MRPRIKLLVVGPVSDPFPEALEYIAYSLADKYSHFDDEVAQSVTKRAKRPQVQMESQAFDSFHLT